jgi:DNA repair photolyase
MSQLLERNVYCQNETDYEELNAEKHPWKESLKVVNKDYLIKRGVNLDNIDSDVLRIVEDASLKAIQDFSQLGGRPPLLRYGHRLQTVMAPIPSNLKIEKHCNCDECPTYIKEVIPSQPGCQINCQYCLSVANTAIQTKVRIYENYAEWFRKQLSINRVQNKDEFGKLYYWSPKTEALSPEMVELGIAQEILCAFEDHVIEEQKRLGGRCPDTLLVITKAGKQELSTKGPDGKTILELMRRIPDNIQVCGSVNYLNYNKQLREALEPGARPAEDRFEFLRILQKNNIQASGLLFQPIFAPFIPDESYFRMLTETVGIQKMHIDILTSNIRSLAVVMQIVGWYYPEAEKQMWDLYLPQEGPEKGGNRRSIAEKMQKEIIEGTINSARKVGVQNFTYCRFTQKAVGLPPRPEKEECMSYITPTPENIRKSRQNQLFSPGKD